MKSTISGLNSFVAFVLLAAVHKVSAHTWTDQITRIASNGTFTGTPGYPRGFNPRTGSANPSLNVYELQGDIDNMPICKSTQQPGSIQPYGADTYPNLQALAGEFVAMRYTENGHVTEPNQAATDNAAKGFGSGLVYVYGSEDPKVDETYGTVKAWNKDGTGGDKRGKLLAVQYFDDMQCYLAGNVNGGLDPLIIGSQTLAELRAQAYPHTADTLPFTGDSLACQTDFRIPSDVTTNTNYSIYWVWDWPTLNNADASIVTNQTYTSCADITIYTSDNNDVEPLKYETVGQDYNSNAQWSQMLYPFVVDPTAAQKTYETRSTTNLFASPTPPAWLSGSTAATSAAGAAGADATTAAGTPVSSSSRRYTTSTTTVTRQTGTAGVAAATAGITGSGGTSPTVLPFMRRSPKIRGREVI